MGAPQIMGFNHKRCGYPEVEQMFEAFNTSEENQQQGFINFISSDHRLVEALEQKDWLTFARIYNGPGQAEHYATLLEQTYNGLT